LGLKNVLVFALYAQGMSENGQGEYEKSILEN
jgi:hypothetical protein